MDCIFCKIINKQIKANIVFEDNDVLAFEDTNPQAPMHILIIPKQHIKKMQDISDQENIVLMKMLAVVPKIALDKSIDLSGYRVVINNGKDAGAEVDHLHIHLLGGRHLQWPPG